MEFSPHDLISPNEILSEVLLYTQEQRYGNVTKGFVISQMNKCMKALSYHTFFNEMHVSFDIPENGIVEIPCGVFNINQVYLFSGENCNIGSNTANVYFKRNYFSPSGNGYVARNKGNNGNRGQDPFYSSTSGLFDPFNGARTNQTGANSINPNGLFYYGESNGHIMLSPNCKTYGRVMIKFNGIWQIDEDKKTIPSVFQEVLVDWCTESVLRVKSVVAPNLFRALHVDSVMRLGYKPESYEGSWYKAKVLVTNMGSKKKEDLKEYLSRLNY